MRVAIASEKENVSEHFGYCEGFAVYNIVDNKVLESEFIPNPGHRPGFLPRFLKEKNIDLIISGGMGGSAYKLFESNGIQVIIGARGTRSEILKLYLSGELKSTGTTCDEHS